MNKETSPGVRGLLNLAKPPGWTSRAVVDRVVRCHRRVKVGHAGTLDPLATGVLVVCVGAATRLIEYVQRMPKTYRTVVRLGARSDTDDADGVVTVNPRAAVPTSEAVRAAVATQVGAISQRPPEYSALKIEGRRAYDLARSGRTVTLSARIVVVHRIEVLAYEWPSLEFEVECDGGTYIRSIARDVGELLGCGGLVQELTRTRIGGFTLANAVDVDALTPATIPGLLLPALTAVAGLPRLRLTAAQLADVRQGRVIFSEDVPNGEVALIDEQGELAAIGVALDDSGRINPTRVLHGDS